jgi:ABC-2 type transport system ATP-binding protein
MAVQSPADAEPLRAEGIARSYGRLEALAELDLRVGAGECVALIGANGSGKTTAVRIVAGLLEPTQGTVRVGGFDPHREPEAEGARAALALVPDTPVLYDDLTVRRHLELVALAHGVADDGLEERISSLLERLRLPDRAEFVPRELSRGMRQKTQLACALVRPAALVVLDEPVVGLDPPSQRLLREILAERKAAGAGVLFTTHQLAFADGLADRAVVLQEGRVVDAGPWAAVRGRAEAEGWDAR